MTHFPDVVEILWVFPGISLYPVAFPLDQVLEFPSEHPTVQDLFHNIFLFPIHKFWEWWRVSRSSGNQVIDIEDWVKASHWGEGGSGGRCTFRCVFQPGRGLGGSVKAFSMGRWSGCPWSQGRPCRQKRRTVLGSSGSCSTVPFRPLP